MTGKAFLILVSCLISVVIGAIILSIAITNHLRTTDAEKAFRPIQHLGCTVYSLPAPLHRYCFYAVEFPPESRLSDANVTELASLNKLPAQNQLHVVIRTSAITDYAVPYLKEITNIDELYFEGAAVSNDGIEELRRTLPHTVIHTGKR